MNMRNWRPETQLATIVGIAWLGWAVLLAISIGETAQGGQWVQFAVFLLCAVLITFVFCPHAVVRGASPCSQQSTAADIAL